MATEQSDPTGEPDKVAKGAGEEGSTAAPSGSGTNVQSTAALKSNTKAGNGKGNNAKGKQTDTLKQEAPTPPWKSYGEDGRVYIREGKAKIIFPSDNSVFYNPVQEFNRDMSIAAISTWSKMFFMERVQKAAAKRKSDSAASSPSKEITEDAASNNDAVKAKPLMPIVNAYIDEQTPVKMEDLIEPDMPSPEYKDKRFTILEALSATGLRSIRYAKEIEAIKTIVANDLLEDAVEAITTNVKYNEVDQIVKPNQGDAAAVMYQSIDKPFDVIDLDPYGSASPFIDPAVQAVSDGGLLCITCTDMAVLAGSQADACWAKYGAMPIPNAPYCHEMGLRILLNTVQSSAARYKRVIEPLLSLSIDFYVRVFVRVYTSAQMVKKAAGKTSIVYHCTGCKSFVTQPMGKSPENGDGRKVGPVVGPIVGSNCEHCGKRFHIGGPFWNAPIHNKEFVARILKHIKGKTTEDYGTKERMIGMLTVVSEELPTPFYYEMSQIAGVVRSTTPRLVQFLSALLNMNYKVSLTHAATNSFKTNASPAAVWDIMRKFVKKHPVKMAAFAQDAPGLAILSGEMRHTVSFDTHPAANPPSRKIKLVRYQENPTKNWGPMARAGKKREKKIQHVEQSIPINQTSGEQSAASSTDATNRNESNNLKRLQEETTEDSNKRPRIEGAI